MTGERIVFESGATYRLPASGVSIHNIAQYRVDVPEPRLVGVSIVPTTGPLRGRIRLAWAALRGRPLAFLRYDR